MEKRVLLHFTVSIFALSILLESSFVLCDPGDTIAAILGDGSTGSWKDQLSSSNAEAPGPTDGSNMLVLAKNRTNRPDILSKFHEYRGGWDIANKHYWASVGFTGAADFSLAILWFISFGFALVMHYFCGWKINIGTKESRWSLRLCLALLLIFTIAVAVGCTLLSVGQNEFHGETLHTLKYVVNQSDYTVRTLRNVTGYLSHAKTISIAQSFLPSDVLSDIDQLNVDLNKAADTLELKTKENSIKIRNVFNAVKSALIAVAAVMLLVSILGLVLSVLGHQNAIHIFVISGWLLVAATFILCGVFVILNNAISDTCMAMGEWVENPHAEVALNNILPCVDEKTTNQTLFKSKLVVNDIANMVNGFVGSIANINSRPGFNASYYNQSGPFIPPLCYPYDAQLQDRQCSASEISTGNASIVWQNYTCTVSLLGICDSVGRLTPYIYSQLVGAVNVSYALQYYTPPLLDFQNCNFVRDSFRNITSNYCPRIEEDLHNVNTGLTLIAVGVMLSLALWMVYVSHPQREEEFVEFSSRMRGTWSGKKNDGESGEGLTTL